MNQSENNRNSSDPHRTRAQHDAAVRKKKLRAKKMQRRRIFWLCALAVSLVVLAGVIVKLIQPETSTVPPSSESQTSQSVSQAQSVLPQPTINPTPEPTPKPEPTVDPDYEWQMRLVNAQNPLPDDFTPALAEIPGAGGREFDERAVDALTQMLQDGNAQGLSLMVCSAYRSIARQDYLFNSMLQDYMAKGYSEEEAYRITSTIRTPHGCSEHSTGLAADIVAVSYQTLDSGFANTAEGKWLAENCTQYGFILRYPEDKQDVTGIIYEPWHFRYVGKENAQKIKDSGLCLEEYLT